MRTFEDGDAIVVVVGYSGTQTGDLAGPRGTIPRADVLFALRRLGP